MHSNWMRHLWIYKRNKGDVRHNLIGQKFENIIVTNCSQVQEKLDKMLHWWWSKTNIMACGSQMMKHSVQSILLGIIIIVTALLLSL